MSSSTVISGDILPFHVLMQVFSYLEPYEAYFLSQVCRWWRDIVRGDAPLRAQMERNLFQHREVHIRQYPGAVHWAIGHGYLTHVAWFMSHGMLRPLSAMQWAIHRGRDLALLETVTAHLSVHYSDIPQQELMWAMDRLIADGALDMVQHMYRQQWIPWYSPPVYEAIMCSAAKHNQLAIMQWVYGKWNNSGRGREQLGEDILNEALYGFRKSPEMAQWLYDEGHVPEWRLRELTKFEIWRGYRGGGFHITPMSLWAQGKVNALERERAETRRKNALVVKKRHKYIRRH
jgi:hypothetical protein